MTLIAGTLSLHPRPAPQQSLDAYRIGAFSLPSAASKKVAITQLPGTDGSASAAEAATTNVAPPLATNGDVPSLGRSMNAMVFGDASWAALDSLWIRESNWNPNSRNRYSGACGIPQALPCSKISDMSPQGQISWGLQYIQRRYGNPQNAWAHEQSFGWY